MTQFIKCLPGKDGDLDLNCRGHLKKQRIMRSTCFPNAGETGEFLRPAGKLEPLDLGAPGPRGRPCFKNSP